MRAMCWLDRHGRVAQAVAPPIRCTAKSSHLKELATHAHVRRVGERQLHGNGKEVEAVHGHPRGSVRLFQVPAGRERRGAIKHANVVQACTGSWQKSGSDVLDIKKRRKQRWVGRERS